MAAVMLVLLSLFGVVDGSVPLCNLLGDASAEQHALTDDILAANKVEFKGFHPIVTRALSATGSAYMEITGYSTKPQVVVGEKMIISPASCVDEVDRSASLTPSWVPFACAAMLFPGNRMVGAMPFLVWAQGSAATSECTPTVEVTIYTPPGPMSVDRSGCHSEIAKNVTADQIVGGTLYVYVPSAAGTKAWKTIADKPYVDLADESIKAGCVPKHKPHMVVPSPDGKYTAVTYTGDQDYAVLSNAEYSVVQCPSVEFLKPKVFGGAVHTGAWHTRDTFLAVDMTGCVDGTCGGAIHRHDFTYDGNGVMTGSSYNSSLGHEDVASLRGTEAVGTKPIAIGNNPLGSYSHLFFVTDAKGAGSIMNAQTMTWDSHFDVSLFGNCSGGGLWLEPHPEDERIVLAQYGKQDAASCIFSIDMENRALTKLVQLPDNADAHGMQFCETTGGTLTVINTNRQTATLDVINYADGSYLLHGYDMNAEAFDAVQASFRSEGNSRRLDGQDKLQPDVAYLHDGYLYMAARGPRPVSAVKEQNFVANAHPGMMALKIDPDTCLPDADQSAAFALTTLERSPEITSDVHGIWGVMNGDALEMWAVDQAGTGSVQQYEVYSACAAYGVDASAIHDDPSPHDGD